MKFLNKAGIILETNDPDRIECFKAQGLQEYIENPQPSQKNVKIVDEFTVKKKPVKKTK